jgi:hypothetical protein
MGTTAESKHDDRYGHWEAYLPVPEKVSMPDEERARLVREGLLCCELAEVIGCVCMLAFRCPVHWPHERHIGTHD